jgi:hypothetical protein
MMIEVKNNLNREIGSPWVRLRRTAGALKIFPWYAEVILCLKN